MHPQPHPQPLTPDAAPADARGTAWLHGVEGVTQDAAGYVYWRGKEIEHYSFGRDREIDEQTATRQLQRTCLALEANGRAVTQRSYLDWIAVYGRVRTVACATFTDVFGCEAFYARYDTAYTTPERFRAERAAKAAERIYTHTGMTAHFVPEAHCDPAAIVLVKIARTASAAVTDEALNDLRARLLAAFPTQGPGALHSLVRESSHEDGAIVTYVGMSLYSGAFERPEHYGIDTTLAVLRDFALLRGSIH